MAQVLGTDYEDYPGYYEHGRNYPVEHVIGHLPKDDSAQIG